MSSVALVPLVMSSKSLYWDNIDLTYSLQETWDNKTKAIYTGNKIIHGLYNTIFLVYLFIRAQPYQNFLYKFADCHDVTRTIIPIYSDRVSWSFKDKYGFAYLW